MSALKKNSPLEKSPSLERDLGRGFSQQKQNPPLNPLQGGKNKIGKGFIASNLPTPNPSKEGNNILIQYITVEPHLKNAQEALEAGVKWIQLRVKNVHKSLLLGGDLEVGLANQNLPTPNPSKEGNIPIIERGKIPLSSLKGIDIETNRRKIIPYNYKLKEIANRFRKNLTLTETILWFYLKGKKISGFDFDRQRPIFEFIVDFYCKDLMLAIEVDGKVHDYQYHKDKSRQSKIEEFGVSFLRFTDDEVYNDIDNVLRTIEIWIDNNTNPPFSPLQNGHKTEERSPSLERDLGRGFSQQKQDPPLNPLQGGEAHQTALAIQKLCKKHQATFIINDNVELVKEIKADGVHLGLSDMPIKEARRILGDDFIIGGTANSFEDILLHANSGANYVGLGPFKFTETKKNLSPVLGIEGYKRILKKCKEGNIKIPIIVIGGIEVKDIEDLLKTGVSGIAVSSLITNSKNKKETVLKIKTALKQSF